MLGDMPADGGCVIANREHPTAVIGKAGIELMPAYACLPVKGEQMPEIL